MNDVAVVAWVNEVMVDVLLIGGAFTLVMTDLGMPLSTVAFLAGYSESVAINEISTVHHRALESNLLVFASWLAFTAQLVAVRSDTTRVVQGVGVVISFFQSMILMTWAFFQAAKHRRRKAPPAPAAPYRHFVGPLLCVLADLYNAIVLSTSLGLFLAAYAAARTISYHKIKRRRRSVVVLLLGATASCAGIGVSAWASDNIVSLVVCVLITVLCLGEWSLFHR